MKIKEKALDVFGFFKIVFTFLLFLLLLMMIYKVFLGEFSISNLSKVEEKQLSIEEAISFLKNSNEELEKENHILNSDKGLEGLARSELGMIKEGETFYQFEVDSPTEN